MVVGRCRCRRSSSVPDILDRARRRRKKSRHQRPFSFCLLTFLLSAFAGHVSGPSFPFSCVLAHGEHPVINESCVWAFAGHVMALLSLLFLCACARASPAIVSFFFVAVCFVWYASFDTPTVYRLNRGGVAATSTGDDFLGE